MPNKKAASKLINRKIFRKTLAALTSTLEQNADIAMWNSYSMYFRDYKDQHCDPKY